MAWHRFVAAVLLIGLSASCREAEPQFHRQLQTEAVVHPSASGWSLRLGPDGTTVVVSPSGNEFNVGKTDYPDWVRTTLWLVHVPTLKHDFLVLHVPPMASGATILTLFAVDPAGRHLTRSADIRHHYEWKAGDTGADEVRDCLFVDRDLDGVPELADHDVWKWGGTVTYYALVGERFLPRWRETYDVNDATAKVELTSVERVGE